ncbi:unnamed protein product, partial [marine sediment metagenome]
KIWNNRLKEHDLEKTAHYAEQAWTMPGGEVVKNEMMGDH